jgi:pimeloyl-ACP methyl ester carboxylesterase
MKQLATDTIERLSLALLGADPFCAAMEFACQKLTKSDEIQPGDGHAVVIFPGLGTDGTSLATLREPCRSLGYDAFDWGQGFNTGPQGDLDAWLHTLKSQVNDPIEQHTQPVTLIGWSLGGLYAREISKLMAPRVRQVITIATPFNAQADHTNVGWLYRLLSGGPLTISPKLCRRLRAPPPLRTNSIYSCSDGVVTWQTCRHSKPSSLVHAIEVHGSHIGMSWNREVLAAVADRLGQTPGPWHRDVHRSTVTYTPQEVHTMRRTLLHLPHHPGNDVPDELEPGALPVEPDEGPVPSHIPDDPEHERVIDPGENMANLAQPTYRQVEAVRCP